MALIFLDMMVTALVLAMYAGGRFRVYAEFAQVPEWVLPVIMLIGFNSIIVIGRMTAFQRALFPGMERPPTLKNAEPADFPQLDTITFDRYDAQLIGLGFEPRFSYASGWNLSSNIKGFTRLYYHPMHRCFVTNAQMFQGSTRTAMLCIYSELDDKWLLSTVNMKPSPLNCMWRRRRALWNTVPGGEPSELLDAHLHLRQQMIDGLGVGVVTDDRNQQAYLEFLTGIHRQQLEQLKRKNIILLYLGFEFYKIKPIYTWMGDLEKVEGARRL